MFKTKFGKRLFSLLLVLAAVFALASCTGTVDPSQDAIAKATANAEEIHTQLIWDKTAMSQITSNVKGFITKTKHENVTVAWESSEPDVLDNTGRVTLPNFDDERAIVVEEATEDKPAIKAVPVIITATITARAEWEISGKTYYKEIELTKEFRFTVATIAEGTKAGTIADVKAAAATYVYDEQGVQRELVSNSSVVYSAMVEGVVTAILNANGAGQFMIHDGTEGIYVYKTVDGLKVGDKVSVVGEIYSYYGALQFGSNLSVTVIQEGAGLDAKYRETTPQELETEGAARNDKGLVKAGYYGGELVNVYGKLVKEAAPGGSSDQYHIADAKTGEKLWIYYKSYNEEMEAKLQEYIGKYVNIQGVTYDRDSRMQKNEILWDGNIVEAAAPTLTDADKVAIALAAAVVPAQADADFEVALEEGYVWEVVSGAAIAFEGNVAKVTRGGQDEVVTIRLTVTVGEASDSKEFQVAVPAAKLNIISIAEAIALAGTEHNVYTTDKYYVQGVVAEIANDIYGNMYIEDATGRLYVYGTYSADGAVRFDKLEAQPQVGDIVTLYGILGAYNGTPQMKNSWVAEYYDVVTLPEAVELAGTDGSYTEKAYTIQGVVTEIANATYGNLYVSDGTNSFYVYGIYDYKGNKYNAMEYKPQVGDHITLTGSLGSYKGTAQMKNATLVETISPLSTAGLTANAVAREDNNYTDTLYYAKGVVTEVKNATYGNIYIQDETGTIYVYGLYNADGSVRFDKLENQPQVGDTVIIRGHLGNYKGTAQLKNAQLIVLTAGSGEAPHEHEFVNGKCECGEVDPNYTPDTPEQPSQPGQTLTVTFDDTAKRTSIDGSHQTWQENGVTLLVEQNTSTSAINEKYFNPLRVYKNHKFTISADQEFSVVKFTVYFNNGASTYVDAFKKMTMPAGATLVMEENVATITLAAPTKSFALVADNAQIRLVNASVVVGGSAPVEPEVPAHKHEACPTCGLCVAEDCDGAAAEKCPGHSQTPDTPEVPEGQISLKEAIELANKQAHNTYTSEKYTVTGKVYDLYNTIYGNMHLIDDAGNDLTIYGLYIEGSKYGDYAGAKPVEGDIITVTGILGTYNGKPQMKNADLVITPAEPEVPTHEHVACPTCGKCTAADCTGAAEEKCAGHELVDPSTCTHEGGKATCQALAVCPKCGTSYGELAEHVDTNLDITCDYEGCTKRILPAGDSKVSLFTAKHMIIVSLSNSYYVEGVVVTVYDAKNGVFAIRDEAGDELLVRLPKNAEGASYSAWTDLKVCLGDTIQVYGKPTRNTSTSYSQEAKIEGGVLTVLKHEHKFSEATCTDPSVCECLVQNAEALGHADADGNKLCDRCQFDLTLSFEKVVVATDPALANGVLDEAKTFWTWAGNEFDVIIAKGESTFTLYTTAKAYMQLKKQNTITVDNKNGLEVKTITFYVTTTSYLNTLKTAFAEFKFTADEAKLSLTVEWNSTEDFVGTNKATSTVYINGVEVLYKKAGEVTPEVPAHTHEACPTCGLCVATDCNGTDAEKCAGHEVVEGPKEYTCAEANTLPAGTEVVLKGTVSQIDGEWDTYYKNMSVTLKDETGTFYLFRLATQVQLGDIVTVTGIIGVYNEANQLTQGGTAVVTGHDASYDKPVVAGVVTIKFNDKAARTEFDTNHQVWEQNGIKVTNNKAASTNNVADYANPARFYASSELIIEYTANIEKVVINTAGGKNFASSLKIDGCTVTVNGTVCTIVLNTPATSVTIAKLAAQVRVASIEVYPAQ